MNENNGKGWLILGIIICILYAFCQCAAGPDTKQAHTYTQDSYGNRGWQTVNYCYW